MLTNDAYRFQNSLVQVLWVTMEASMCPKKACGNQWVTMETSSCPKKACARSMDNDGSFNVPEKSMYNIYG